MREGGDAAVQAVNLLDDLDATLQSVDAERGAFPVAPILRPGEPADATVIVRDEARVPDLLRALDADAAIASVARERQRYALRFADERVAELGASLEAGASAGMATDDLLTDEPYIVDFCDPNATKALHIGHLRNIALGHAIASALSAAGARVIRQSHIGDAGRSMGEAMAGYVRYADGTGTGTGTDATPQRTGEKSDHFVGRLYARYVQETAIPVDDVNPEDVAVARETDVVEDLAHELLMRLDQEDPEVVELWKTVRAWATEGQDATLARLGVHFDRTVFDSDYSPHVAGFVERALAQGVLTRAESGALGYDTGQEEYAWLPLTRADGFPTQNLRGLVMWHRFMHDFRDATLIHLSGLEWRTHTIHVEQILRTLTPELPVYPSMHVRHGMVTIEGGVVSSSAGGGLLIDELLDALVARPEIHALAHEQAPGCGAEELAAIALLASFLNRPTVKSLVFDADHVLDAEANVGWWLAQAWAHANTTANDGAPEPDPADADYRFAVMQSQLHRRLLGRSLQKLDLLDPLRFLVHLSEWYLAEPRTPRTGRVVRTILRDGLGALGLIGAEVGR
jgi:arginyl-tRNA synthetase